MNFFEESLSKRNRRFWLVRWARPGPFAPKTLIG